MAVNKQQRIVNAFNPGKLYPDRLSLRVLHRHDMAADDLVIIGIATTANGDVIVCVIAKSLQIGSS